MTSTVPTSHVLKAFKRTQATHLEFPKREDLLSPPAKGVTWRWRPQKIMADGAEAGPNSVMESQAQAPSSPAHTSAVLSQEVELLLQNVGQLEME